MACLIGKDKKSDEVNGMYCFVDQQNMEISA